MIPLPQIVQSQPGNFGGIQFQPGGGAQGSAAGGGVQNMPISGSSNLQMASMPAQNGGTNIGHGQMDYPVVSSGNQNVALQTSQGNVPIGGVSGSSAQLVNAAQNHSPLQGIGGRSGGGGRSILNGGGTAGLLQAINNAPGAINGQGQGSALPAGTVDPYSASYNFGGNGMPKGQVMLQNVNQSVNNHVPASNFGGDGLPPGRVAYPSTQQVNIQLQPHQLQNMQDTRAGLTDPGTQQAYDQQVYNSYNLAYTLGLNQGAIPQAYAAGNGAGATPIKANSATEMTNNGIHPMTNGPQNTANAANAQANQLLGTNAFGGIGTGISFNMGNGFLGAAGGFGGNVGYSGGVDMGSAAGAGYMGGDY